jgi:hypothetical protein
VHYQHVARSDSVARAQLLVDQILSDARANDNRALLAANADPDTETLLDLLPEGKAVQARQHLHGVRIWLAQQNEKAKRKLSAAQTALDGFDLVVARGILRKIDSSVLDKETLARYDELFLAVEARAVELEDIQSRLPSPPPDQRAKPRKRFWKR